MLHFILVWEDFFFPGNKAKWEMKSETKLEEWRMQASIFLTD